VIQNQLQIGNNGSIISDTIVSIIDTLYSDMYLNDPDPYIIFLSLRDSLSSGTMETTGSINNQIVITSDDISYRTTFPDNNTVIQNMQKSYMLGTRAYVQTPKTNVTGDASGYNIQYDAVKFDPFQQFNTTTGQFTAKQAGLYRVTHGLTLSGIQPSHTAGYLALQTTSGKGSILYQGKPANIVPDPLFGLNTTIVGETIVRLNKGESCWMYLYIAGGSKVISVVESSDANNDLNAVTWINFEFIGTEGRF
jgi:hypothetical protein